VQIKPKTQATTQTRKAFQWGISSTKVSFMQPGEVEAARDGTDCSKISPLPQPGRKPSQLAECAK
jgi:hypothetical protein